MYELLLITISDEVVTNLNVFGLRMIDWVLHNCSLCFSLSMWILVFMKLKNSPTMILNHYPLVQAICNSLHIQISCCTGYNCLSSCIAWKLKFFDQEIDQPPVVDIPVKVGNTYISAKLLVLRYEDVPCSDCLVDLKRMNVDKGSVADTGPKMLQSMSIKLFSKDHNVISSLGYGVEDG
ncbi:hypothetical protein Tco_0087166 [Tanacetum coccineum]